MIGTNEKTAKTLITLAVIAAISYGVYNKICNNKKPDNPLIGG